MYGDNFKNQENTKISFNPRALAGRDSDDPARAGHRQRFNGATSFQTWKRLMKELFEDGTKASMGHVFSDVETRGQPAGRDGIP